MNIVGCSAQTLFTWNGRDYLSHVINMNGEMYFILVAAIDVRRAEGRGEERNIPKENGLFWGYLGVEGKQCVRL